MGERASDGGGTVPVDIRFEFSAGGVVVLGTSNQSVDIPVADVEGGRARVELVHPACVDSDSSPSEITVPVDDIPDGARLSTSVRLNLLPARVRLYQRDGEGNLTGHIEYEGPRG